MNIRIFLLSFITCFTFFGSAQQLNRMLIENWEKGAWENRMQQLPFYDDEGRIIRKEMTTWNKELQVWENNTKTSYVRDENGALLKREELKWSQSKWNKVKRMSYSLDEQDKPISVLTEVHDGKAWNNQIVDEYVYDANGMMIEKRSQRWNQQSNEWIQGQKFVYTYDINRKTGYIIYFWNAQIKDWQLYKKVSYNYHDGDQVDQILFESWAEGNWEKNSVRKYTYDEDETVGFIEVDKFEPISEEWQKSTHVDYEFNNLGEIATSISKKRNQTEVGWVNLQRSTYSYTEGETVKDALEDGIELFPNPAKETISIRTNSNGELIIFDALGKKVMEMENQEAFVTVDISKWENGAYSVKVNGCEVQKFVKE